MIISQPGRFEGGGICDTPVNLVDIAPTFLSAAGIQSIRTHELDGEDMFDVMSGTSDRTTVFSQLSYEGAMTSACIDPSQSHYLEQKDEIKRAHFSSYMAVSREHKYIYSAPDNRKFFFDRQSDPLESRNKAGVDFVQEEKENMKGILIKHLKEGGETAGIDGENWKIFPKITINKDPDTGLLIQDGYTPWADMQLPEGYMS